MKLAELSFACYTYGWLSSYDLSYRDFLDAVGNSPNLMKESHRVSLLTWLNKWGCRQFAKKYYRQASNGILRWYKQSRNLLCPVSSHLLSLTEKEIDNLAQAYEWLLDVRASTRSYKNGPVLQEGV